MPQDWTQSAEGIRKFYARRREAADHDYKETVTAINREEMRMLAAFEKHGGKR